MLKTIWIVIIGTVMGLGPHAHAIKRDDGPPPPRASSLADCPGELVGGYVWVPQRPPNLDQFWPDVLDQRRFSAGTKVKILEASETTSKTSAVGHQLMSASRHNYRGRAPELATAWYAGRSGEQIAVHNGHLEGTRDSIGGGIDFNSRLIDDPNVLMLVVEHTHPHYDIEVADPLNRSSHTIFRHPLSESDLRSAYQISRQYPRVYIREVANVPNGYSYTRTFLNGQLCVDPFLKR